MDSRTRLTRRVDAKECVMGNDNTDSVLSVVPTMLLDGVSSYYVGMECDRSTVGDGFVLFHLEGFVPLSRSQDDSTSVAVNGVARRMWCNGCRPYFVGVRREDGDLLHWHVVSCFCGHASNLSLHTAWVKCGLWQDARTSVRQVAATEAETLKQSLVVKLGEREGNGTWPRIA